MGARYYAVDNEVVAMADELIELYHEELQDADIGIIFRDVAPVANGKATLGKARKVTAEWKVHVDLDFVIWLAHDEWKKLHEHQRKALLDHELCHCSYSPLKDEGSILPHDIEEFNAVIRRWGLWWPGSIRTERAIQGMLDFAAERTGRVVAMKSLDDDGARADSEYEPSEEVVRSIKELEELGAELEVRYVREALVTAKAIQADVDEILAPVADGA